MERAGIVTLVGMLLLLPFQLLFALAGTGRRLWLMNAQRRRFLTPHELNLRRASHPAGVLAVLLTTHALYAARFGSALAALNDHHLLMSLAAVAIIGGLVPFLVGVRRSAGLRDGILTMRAAFRIALGLVLVFWLARLPVAAFDAGAQGEYGEAFRQTALLFGLWFLVTGGMRLLLLTVGGGSALRLVRKLLHRRNATMRPARRRRFWWFW